MTKVFYISLFSFFCFNAQAQTLSFETEEYDFGDIAELGGAASYRFVYTNTGHKPLIINSVYTSCGCTSPAWSSEPVLPQSQGFVDVTFDPRNRQGGFTKSIIVKSNGGEKTLYISGNVLPKPDPISAEYPFKMFDLRLKTTTVNFNKLTFPDSVTREIEVYNPTKANLKIETQNTDYAIVTPKPQILKPGEKGVLKCVFNSKFYDGFDFVKFDVPVFVNTYEYKLSFKAQITEEFSPEEKKNPPVMSFRGKLETINLEAYSEEEPAFCALTFYNSGKSPLKIRAVRNACQWLKCEFDKNALPEGKTGEIKFEFDTRNRPGLYDRYVTIVTNSPETQYVIVHFRLNVIKGMKND